MFTGIRGWSAGISGLAFAGMAVGCFVVIGSEPLVRRMINAHKKDPETGKVPPEAMYVFLDSDIPLLKWILGLETCLGSIRPLDMFQTFIPRLEQAVLTLKPLFRVSVICIAAALTPIGELWFAVCAPS